MGGETEWQLESVATFAAGCIAYHGSSAVKRKATDVTLAVCRLGAAASVERLAAQPPVADQAARERVTAALTGVLGDYTAELEGEGAAGQTMPPAADAAQTRAQSSYAAEREIETAAVVP